MAIYNEILAGRYARALQKIFGIKGTVPAKQLAGEIMAVHDLFSGAENRFADTWNRIGGRILAAGVAANQSAGRLLNPAGSGVVAVIEKVWAFTPAAALQTNVTVERPASLGTFPLVGSQIAFDKRGSSGSAVDGVCLVQGKNNNATVFGIVVGAPSILANSTLDLIVTDIQEVPLLPGDSFDVTAGAVNQAIDVAFWWRERPMEDSELK